MIHDSLDNVHRYLSISPHMPAVLAQLDLLRRDNFSNVSQGKHDLPPSPAFYYCFEYTTRDPDECRGESHRKYFDIHLILQGSEDVGFLANEDSILGEFHDANDHMTADGSFQKFTLRRGHFAAFFPGEAHITGIASADAGKTALKKLVFKVPV